MSGARGRIGEKMQFVRSGTSKKETLIPEVEGQKGDFTAKNKKLLRTARRKKKV